MIKREYGVCSQVEGPSHRELGELGRRDFLFRLGGGLGSLALTHLLQQDGFLADTAPSNPLAAKAPHFRTPAKACIFFFMYGGASHIDTFDPKPALAKYHGTPTFTIPLEGGSKEKSLYVGSPFKFSKHGQSGMEVSELLPHLATCVDDLAVVRSLHTDSSIHPNAVFQMNLGLTAPGGPSMGAWVLYGLGSENQDLPGFVVLPDSRGSVWSGPVNWSNGYLPAVYQGTLLNPKGAPIVDLEPPRGVSRDQQQSFVNLLNQLNQGYLGSNPRNSDLLARMKSYELAFRMQMSVPEAVDIESEAEKTKDLYGLNNKITEPMGRKCLLARRLVERGVRFVQVYSHGWDSHENLTKFHRLRCDEIDRPIAGLLKDLKQRGLLDKTLVVWGGEFGRTAHNSPASFRSNPGRDHNKDAMSMWLAGGGVKGGTVVGATDELGEKAVENPYHLHDLHATLLHLLGLDDMRLTYYHAGRFKRLTDLGGRVINELKA